MRRRLMVALVGVALAAVTLVGVGVLVLAQFGARQSARDRVSNQLEVLVELADSSGSFDRFQPTLGRLGDAFGSSEAGLVSIESDGTVVSGLRAGPQADRLRLSPDELAALADGPVVIDRRGSVIGLAGIDARTRRGSVAGRDLTVLVARDVAPLAPQARAWFLLSAGFVVLLSVIVARWLAARFTRPLEEMEAATARIASGDLDTRIEVRGDDELAELAGAINRMASDLGRGRAAEQEFLMSISHDLRTPLTVISGYAEALTDGAATDPAAAGAIIAGNARRLSRLVGDLLDLARLNARQFRLELVPTDAAALVRRVVSDHGPRADSYGVGLRVGAPDSAPVITDPDRVTQIVGNLIDNALKFARTQVTVTVGAGMDGTAVDGITVTVADDGPGIPAEDLPFVFERLYITRLRPTRAENSSGLGLAIVRELASALGGSVEARSRLDHGTVMTVRLPMTADRSERQ